jgi:hypothetical protein
MPKHPLSSAYLMIQNAKARFEAAKQITLAFARDFPTTVIPFKDTVREPPYAFHGFRLTVPIPIELTFAVRDVIHDLRAALDQAGYAAANAQEPTDKYGAFPFGNTRDDALKQKKGRGPSSRVPDSIFDVMMAQRPYAEAGGNHLLFALNEHRNVNDHRFLRLMSTGVSSVDSRFESRVEHIVNSPPVLDAKTLHPQLIFPPRWDDETGELIMFWSDARITGDFAMGAQFYISFGPFRYLESKEVLSTVQEMIVMVEAIISEISRRGIADGLFPDLPPR